MIFSRLQRQRRAWKSSRSILLLKERWALVMSSNIFYSLFSTFLIKQYDRSIPFCYIHLLASSDFFFFQFCLGVPLFRRPYLFYHWWGSFQEYRRLTSFWNLYTLEIMAKYKFFEHFGNERWKKATKNLRSSNCLLLFGRPKCNCSILYIHWGLFQRLRLPKIGFIFS